MGVFQKETKPETEGWNTPQTQRDWYTGLRLPDALALVPALVAFGGQRMLAGYPSFTETWFSARLFRWIADPIAWISSMVPFSLTEFLVWSALPLIIVLGTRVHRRAQVHGKPVWVRAGVHGVWIVSIAYLVFMLLFGFHYGRLPMAERYGLQVKERPVEELAGMTLMLAETASEFRRFVQEDEEGVMVLRKGSTGALRSGYVGFQYASAAYPELKMPRRRAKSVLSSGLWSYTGISGMYFPFFCGGQRQHGHALFGHCFYYPARAGPHPGLCPGGRGRVHRVSGGNPPSRSGFQIQRETECFHPRQQRPLSG